MPARHRAVQRPAVPPGAATTGNWEQPPQSSAFKRFAKLLQRADHAVRDKTVATYRAGRFSLWRRA